jgi:hypothetical protein
MPAYMNSLLCDDGIYPHHETNTDDRAYLRQKILQMNVKASCAYFYPCVYPILNTALDAAIPKPSLRCSIERFKQDQVYKERLSIFNEFRFTLLKMVCNFSSGWGKL